MLKQITVPIIVDDHEPEKCGDRCNHLISSSSGGFAYFRCKLCDIDLSPKVERCKQCLEEAK